MGPHKYTHPAVCLSFCGLEFRSGAYLRWRIHNCMLGCSTSIVFIQAVDSWLGTIDGVDQRSTLSGLFDKYVSSTMGYCNKNLRTVTPMLAINQALSICKILEGLLTSVRSKGSIVQEMHMHLFKESS